MKSHNTSVLVFRQILALEGARKTSKREEGLADLDSAAQVLIQIDQY